MFWISTIDNGYVNMDAMESLFIEQVDDELYPFVITVNSKYCHPHKTTHYTLSKHKTIEEAKDTFHELGKNLPPTY